MIIQYRNVDDFQSLILRGPGQFEVVQAERDKLCIEAAGQYLDQIESKVDSGRLNVGIQSRDVIDLSAYNATIRYRIEVRDLRRLKVLGQANVVVPDMDRDELFVTASGRSNITLSKLTADRVTIRIDGRSEVKISGDVEQQTIELSDQGKLLSDELICDRADCRMTGSASAEIRVNDELSVYLAEAARLTYVGYPDVEKYGSGTLVRRRKQTPTTRGTEHG